MKRKIDTNKITYLKLILDLSDEVEISIQEAKNLADNSLYFIRSKKINYKELKEEILSFILINVFSLICKL